MIPSYNSLRVIQYTPFTPSSKYAVNSLHQNQKHNISSFDFEVPQTSGRYRKVSGQETPRPLLRQHRRNVNGQSSSSLNNTSILAEQLDSPSPTKKFHQNYRLDLENRGRLNMCNVRSRIKFQFCVYQQISMIQSTIPQNERRKHSIVVQQNDREFKHNDITLKNFKQITEFDAEMNLLQQKIWALMTLTPQDKLDKAFNLSVLANNHFEEFEFKFNIENLPYNWKVHQLLPLINQAYVQQKGTQYIQTPQLSMLVGRIKTQRLDSGMNLYEIVNLILNGLDFLVLEELRML